MEKEVAQPYYEDDYQSLDEVDTVDLLEMKEGGWIVYYDHGCETLAVCDFDYYDAGEPVRYATREEAEKSIEENREDWKIYFGIDPLDTDKS